MIVLNAGDTIYASNESDFLYYFAIVGKEGNTASKMLTYDFCGKGFWDLYTATDKNVTIESIFFNNTTSSEIKNIRLFVNGTGLKTNTILTFHLPEFGSAIYNHTGLHVYNSDGTSLGSGGSNITINLNSYFP